MTSRQNKSAFSILNQRNISIVWGSIDNFVNGPLDKYKKKLKNRKKIIDVFFYL
jgi:hypothetical protein